MSNSSAVSSTGRPPTRTCRAPTSSAIGPTTTLGSTAAGLGPAQHRAQPGQQLARRERLGDVVVGAQLEPHDAIGLVPARGQHDDGHLALLADAPADLQPVHARHHDVQQDGVEHAARERREPLAPSGRAPGSRRSAPGSSRAARRAARRRRRTGPVSTCGPLTMLARPPRRSAGPRWTSSASRAPLLVVERVVDLREQPHEGLAPLLEHVSWRANCSPSSTPSNDGLRSASASSWRLRFPSSRAQAFQLVPNSLDGGPNHALLRRRRLDVAQHRPDEDPLAPDAVPAVVPVGRPGRRSVVPARPGVKAAGAGAHLSNGPNRRRCQRGGDDASRRGASHRTSAGGRTAKSPASPMIPQSTFRSSCRLL